MTDSYQTSEPTNREGPRIMSRGLSQVLFNYMPEKTFDYDRGLCIGKVAEILPEEIKDLDKERIFREIKDYVSAWADRIERLPLNKRHVFVFGKPEKVFFNVFPLTYQCLDCRRIRHYGSEDRFKQAPSADRCLHCKGGGKLKQIYHILVHECGFMSGAVPRQCTKCQEKAEIILDDRGSQKAMDFRWKCIRCGSGLGPLQRPCPDCSKRQESDIDEEAEKGVRDESRMRVIPHRANSAYYPHHLTILNIGNEETAQVAGHPHRDEVLIRAYLSGTYNIQQVIANPETKSDDAMPDALERELESIMRNARPGERTKLAETLRIIRETKKLKKEKIEAQIGNPESKTVAPGVWRELFEYMKVRGDTASRGLEIVKKELIQRGKQGGFIDKARNVLKTLHFQEILAIGDFPITTAVFGYTRVGYLPEAQMGEQRIKTRLRGFSPLQMGKTEHSGKTPIYVHKSEVEALFFQADHMAVIAWLRENELVPETVRIDSEEDAKRYLLTAIEDVDRFATFAGKKTITQELFTLFHTMAHLFIRSASQLSGIERTGLSEYLFPRCGAFVIYSTNAVFNIGGLHTLFEENLGEALTVTAAPPTSRQCIYDPFCAEERASCHACTHLGEMACNHFNRGLSRTHLFGNQGSNQGIKRGFWQDCWSRLE